MTDAAPSRPPIRLRIVYRSHGGENAKSRPSYYSKRLSLLSLIRAAEAAEGAEIHFLNDGEIPAPRLEIMERTGAVVPVDGGSNRRSYRAALAYSAQRWATRQDVVWFAEDDYLYTEHAFTTLLDGVRALSDGDYFGLYGTNALETGSPRRRPRSRELPGAADDPDAVRIAGTRWFRMMSTTSTYGVRGDALGADIRLLRFTPYTGGAFDHASCLTVQGMQPYTWGEVATDLLPVRQSPGTWPRAVFRGSTRAIANVLSHRGEDRHRVMYAADPEVACHMETPFMASGTDWLEVARKTAAWSLNAGYGEIDLGPVG